MRVTGENLMTAYGRALYYTYLVEHLLELLLKRAAGCRFNGYQMSSRKIEKLKLDEKIREFGRVFPDAATEVKALDLLRTIRNEITHGWLPQVESLLKTDEGWVQMDAMLARYAAHASELRDRIWVKYQGLGENSAKKKVQWSVKTPNRRGELQAGKGKIERLLGELDKISAVKIDG